MLQIFNPPKRQLEKKLDTFSQKLVQAFAQIKTDMNDINSKLDQQQSELSNLGRWVSYLHMYGQRLEDSHSILLKKQEKITENHHKLHTSHTESASRHAELAEKLNRRHQEISEQLSGHRAELKNSINVSLEGHKELTKRELESMKGWISHISSAIDRERQKSEALKGDVLAAQRAWSADNSALRDLLAGLKSENSELKSSLSQLSENLSETNSKLSTTQNMARSHIEGMKSELTGEISKHISERMGALSVASESRPANSAEISSAPSMQVAPQLAQASMMSNQPVQQSQSFSSSALQGSGFERHIMSRVMPNRKSYVMKFIIDLASENRFSTKEIEEIIVKEKRLCGRTTFYAYLKELRYRGKIGSAEVDERSIVISTERQQTLGETVPRHAKVSSTVQTPVGKPVQGTGLNKDSSEEDITKQDFDSLVDDLHDDGR